MEVFQATIVTPNLEEASVMCGFQITTKAQMKLAATEILKLGCKNVLIKGGHLDSDTCSDLLMSATQEYYLDADRIATRNTHGTGCTLSAAITANLALGKSMKQSCHDAKEYLTNALKSFQYTKIGKGQGPVNHLYQIQQYIK